MSCSDSDSDSDSGLSSRPPSLNPAEPDPESVNHAAGVVKMPSGKDAVNPSKSTKLNIDARAYQMEMLEESLKGNIIVAMDTGSGKTQVAVLRIAKELERTSDDKIIWFLAPTIELCRQQKDVIQSQIQSVQVKILSSLEGVDTWSSQRIWDAVLLDVRVVVATYQILLDALGHGFVKLESIPLIVIDEAHNWKRNNPGARLMRQHYKPRKENGLPVPHILGLTASPILGSNIEEIDILEDILDATCKTPHIHRDELSRYVNYPVLSHIPYVPNKDGRSTPTLDSLRCLQRELDILDDPYIKKLQLDTSNRGRQALQAAIMNDNTWCQQTIKALVRKSRTVYEELGAWAADYFVSEVIKAFTAANEKSMFGLFDGDRRYLVNVLRQIELPQTLDIRSYAESQSQAQSQSQSQSQTTTISDKVQGLLRVLAKSRKDTIGIIFVKERATTIVLEHLLSAVPILKNKFRVGSMVGISSVAAKQDISELLRPKKSNYLDGFRTSKINLLVATNVLEEGIDIPACNLVICFDEPQNLKSFIQRRGRARMRESRLVVMDNGNSRRQWQSLEIAMKSRYQDQEREIHRLTEIENLEEADFPPFIVPSTGARLDISHAISHLDHFCSRLSSYKYASSRPEYISTDTGDGQIGGLVELPIFVPQHLRTAQSSRTWGTQKNAFKDAAFQAYISLYNAGLVNDNLLPNDGSWLLDIDYQGPMCLVAEQYNPWLDIAQAWDQNAGAFDRPIRFKDETGIIKAELVMTLPIQIPDINPLRLYFCHRTEFHCELGSSVELGHVQQQSFRDHTLELLSLAYSGRWKMENRQPVALFHSRSSSLSLDQIGKLPFSPYNHSSQSVGLDALIRDPQGLAYFYEGMVDSKPDRMHIKKRYYGFNEAPENVPYVLCKRFPSSINRQRPSASGQPANQSPKKYAGAIALPHCRVDNISSAYAKSGLCVPAILRTIELFLVANQLSEKLLGHVNIGNLQLLVTAICASSAGEDTNYQKLEFLGDAILKLHTSINCASEKLNYPEGFLSRLKDHFVSNAHLCQAAIDTGLDQFIVTKALRLHKWRPLYVDDMLSAPPPEKRKMSTKMLADVIESLIGVAYWDGGFNKSLECIKTFLTSAKMPWRTMETCQQIMFDAAPDGMELPPDHKNLETLLGYKFKKKSILLEAVTHPSYAVSESIRSLDRLEFIGDAILDYIIVKHLFNSPIGPNHTPANLDRPPLSLEKLHEMRTVLVNADILGFLCMEWGVKQKTTAILPFEKQNKGSNSKVYDLHKVVEEVVEEKQLWKFLRIGCPEMVQTQRVIAERHRRVRKTILQALHKGSRYPWHLFCTMQMPKFYSDIVEAVIGGVWVDSGSFEDVDKVVERLGLLDILNRILEDQVNTMHPKARVGILAGQKTVRYDVKLVFDANYTGDSDSDSDGDSFETAFEVNDEVEAEENAEIDGATELMSESGPLKREYCCELFVGDECRVIAEGGVSREEIQVKAALKAVMNWDPQWAMDQEEDKEEAADEGNTFNVNTYTDVDAMVQDY